jgi:hypothetical protein
VPFDELANVYSVTNQTFIFEADTGSSYDIRFTVTDNFTYSSKTQSASTGFSIMHWLASGLGLALGKIAELENVLDIGFLTRFTGGFLHPTLAKNTDLNDVRTPNTYVGMNVASNNYGNCPIDSGTFTLEVLGAGADGQVKQRLSSCSKTESRTFERFYFENSWGEWVCVSDFAGTLLWSGGYYMTAGHTATLSESISKQRSGIVLVFCCYEDANTTKFGYQYVFVPKQFVAMNPGASSVFTMARANFQNIGTKALYIHDTYIKGNDSNNLTGTANGITYANNKFVLCYVFGV